MDPIPIRIRMLIASLVALAVIAGLGFYLKSRPTVALRTLFTLPGYCDRFNKDGSLIVVRDSLAPISDQSILDTRLGSARLRLSSLASGITFSPDSAFVGAPGQGVYDLRQGQLVLALGSDHYWFSPDGQFVATSADGVYALASGKQLVPANGSTQAAFSPDSRYVALIGETAGDAVYDLRQGQRLFSAPREKWFGLEASFSPDGKYLAVDKDGLYQVSTGRKIAQTSGSVFTSDSALAGTTNGVFDLTRGIRILPETLANESDAAYSKFSRDGQRALIQTLDFAGSPPGEVQITTVYDIQTLRPLIQIKKAVVSDTLFYPAVVLSPDGQALAVWQDGVYDVASGQKRFSIGAKSSAELPYLWPPSFSFSQDNAVLFVPDLGGFDARTGKLRFGMGVLEGASPDGRLISDDQGLLDFATGIRLAEGDVIFAPNGDIVAIYSKTKQACTVLEALPAGRAN